RLSHRRGEPLVSRRLQERTPGPHRVRASVRALDVRGFAAPRPRLLSAAPGCGCDTERIDERGSHELLGGRPYGRARTRAVDGIGPYGLSAPGADGGEILQSARRGAERAAAELRKPS